MTREESHANFARVKREAGWDEDADAVDEVAKVEPRNVREELREQEQAEESRERMDKEFKKALQPGSPISALLKYVCLVVLS